MKKIVMLMAVLMLTQVSAWGMQFLFRDEIILDQNVQVEEDLYMAGEKVIFQGEAQQDLFAAGSSQVVISGKVMQDLNLAAIKVEVRAKVGDDARVVGSEIMFSGSVVGSTLILGSEIFISPESMFEKDVWILGSDVHVSGLVNGNLGIKAKKVLIDATVTGKLYITADSIVLGRKAKILGPMDYISSHEIQTNTGAVVQYPPNWKTPVPKDGVGADSGWKNIWHIGKILFRVSVYLGALIFGCLFVILLPNQIRRYAMVMRYKFWPSMGWGALTVFGTLILLVVLIISLIGIPPAIILGLLFLLVMLAAGIGMGYLLGILLIKPKVGATGPSLGAMALGFTILALMGLIPILGGVLMALVVLVGIGAMWLTRGFEKPGKQGMVKAKPQPQPQPQPMATPAKAIAAKIADTRQKPAVPKAKAKTKAKTEVRSTATWQPPVPAFKQNKAGVKKKVTKKVVKKKVKKPAKKK